MVPQCLSRLPTIHWWQSSKDTSFVDILSFIVMINCAYCWILKIGFQVFISTCIHKSQTYIHTLKNLAHTLSEVENTPPHHCFLTVPHQTPQLPLTSFLRAVSPLENGNCPRARLADPEFLVVTPHFPLCSPSFFSYLLALFWPFTRARFGVNIEA